MKRQNLSECYHRRVNEMLVERILAALPDTQAIYLFGSATADRLRDDSDIDVAVLLPHARAKALGSLALSDLAFDLMKTLRRDVDLINLRQVSSVLQKQVIANGIVLFCADEFAKDEFEMLTISFYQKLNEERARILEFFKEDKHIQRV
jgi:predicted nucleotidyltransferase